MTLHVVIVVILVLVFGCFFFMAEYFEHRLVQLHASFIAGISVAYFFLIVLPEIAEMGKLQAYFHGGFWQCVDTIRDVELLTELEKERPWLTKAHRS